MGRGNSREGGGGGVALSRRGARGRSTEPARGARAGRYATGYLTNFFLSLAPDALQPKFGPDRAKLAEIERLEQVLLLVKRKATQSAAARLPHPAPPARSARAPRGRAPGRAR